MKKTVSVIGAGPGGLTAACLLARRGYSVDLFEKNDQVGGRNARLEIDGFKFDTGPTFLMLLSLLEEVFHELGRNLEDYLELKRIDPLYRLRFSDGTDFHPSSNLGVMLDEIKRVFPGDEKHYLKFLENEGRKFDYIIPCLRVPYSTPGAFFSRRFLRALPHLDFMKNVYDRLASYFSHEQMRISTSFQAKYLGMSPWHCPATFTILPYIEHKWGIFHPIGGLNEISHTMARIFAEEGGRLHLSTPVEQILIENGRAVGVRLQNQREIRSDSVVINADFAYAMTQLVPERHRPKYTDAKLKQREYSCSTFMLYLGLDKLYDIPHHNVVFAKDYHQNIREIIESKVLSADPSYYLQNACITDPTLAPPGKSTLYVLVPVPNNSSGIDWHREKQAFRDKIIAAICRNPELRDLSEHIEVEKVITPADWETEYHVYQGAVFNLSHTIFQMLYLRPRNRFEEFGASYLVGGGTHPGSGLPTIYQSGRISSDLLTADLPQKF